MPGETLRLCLGADKNGDAENDAAKTEKQSPFAMGQKTQGNVKWRRHGSFGGGGVLIIRCRTGSPGCNLSWSETTT